MAVQDTGMATALLVPFKAIGRLTLGVLAHVGRFGMLCVEIVRGLRDWRAWFPRMIDECANVGLGSLPIVIVISTFAGAVTALQTGYQWQTNLPLFIIGTLIVTNIVLELGPVLVGLVLAG